LIPAPAAGRDLSAPVAVLAGVSKEYVLGKTKVRALRNIDLAVNRGEFLVLAGPSGSGKTTILNLLGLIDKPDSGRVIFGGKNTVPLGLNALAPARRDSIGYIFQAFNLIPVLSVFENVEYPLILRRVPAGERRRRVESALEKVGLSHRRKHRPSELSGGERQRTSIARAIVKNPAVVLADEPTANLDSETGATICDLMRRLNRNEGATFVLSSHDPRIIGTGRRIVRLRDGAIEGIEEQGG